jgi:fructokinase
VRNDAILCFGEVLWDCLPRGLFLGGAPLNVARHLARLGRKSAIISAVGEDFLGEEARRRAREAGVDVSLLAHRAGGPTGVARVRLEGAGQPVFELPAPAAWDFIAGPEGATPELRAAVRNSAAFVYGSLAARAEGNRRLLAQLLEEPGPWRIFDVNLRPPYDERARVLALARRAGVVKLNGEELARLSGVTAGANDDPFPALEKLRAETGVPCWCVTLGAAGAWWWDGRAPLRALAPKVTVRDTVGAGDAFLAALVDGLLSAGFPAAAPLAPETLPALLARACRLGALVASREGACPEYRREEIA